MSEHSWIVGTAGGMMLECLGDVADMDEVGFRVYRRNGDDWYLTAFIQNKDIQYVQIVHPMTGKMDGFTHLDKDVLVSR